MSSNRGKFIYPKVKEWRALNVSKAKGLYDIDLLAAILDKYVQRTEFLLQKENIDFIPRIADLLKSYLERQLFEDDISSVTELRDDLLSLIDQVHDLDNILKLILKEYREHLAVVNEMRKFSSAKDALSPQDIILYAELGANYGFHKAVLKTAQTLIEEKHTCTVVYEDNSAYFNAFKSGAHFFIRPSVKSNQAKDIHTKDIERGFGAFGVIKENDGRYTLYWCPSSESSTPLQMKIDLSNPLTDSDGPGWEGREKLRQQMHALLEENFSLLEKDGLKLAKKMFDSDVDVDEFDEGDKSKATQSIATMNALVAFAQTCDNYPEAFVGFGENAFEMIAKKDRAAMDELIRSGVTWVSETQWGRNLRSSKKSLSDKIVILPSSEQMGDYQTQDGIKRKSESRQQTFPEATLIYLQPLCWHGGRAVITPGQEALDIDLCFTALGAIPKNPTPKVVEEKATPLDAMIDQFKGTIVNVYGIHQVDQPPDSVEQLLLNVKAALEDEGRGPVVFIDTTPSKELASPDLLSQLNISFVTSTPQELAGTLKSCKESSCTFVKMSGYLPQSSLDLMLKKSPLGIFSGSNSMESLLSLGNKALVPIHARGMDMPDTWDLDNHHITDLSHNISHVDRALSIYKLGGDATSLSKIKIAYAQAIASGKVSVLTPDVHVVDQLRMIIRREKSPIVEYQDRLQVRCDNPLNDQLQVCLRVAMYNKQLKQQAVSKATPKAKKSNQDVKASQYPGILLPKKPKDLKKSKPKKTKGPDAPR